MLQSSPAIALLGNRFVRSILASVLFVQIGVWIRNFAVLLYIVEQTDGDPIAVSMISVAEFAPMFIFSLIGGTLADRWPPKRTMIWCQALSAISVFVVLITLLFATWHIVLFATLISVILSQVSQPSGMKLFRQHLQSEQVQSAMSLYQMTNAIFLVAGPVFGTYMYHAFGIHMSLVLTGAAFVLAALSLTFIPADRNSGKLEQYATFFREMANGFRNVSSNRSLVCLCLCYLFAGLGMGFVHPLEIFIVTEQLHLPKESLQWLFISYGIGLIAGGMLSILFSKRIPPLRLLIIGMAGQAIGWSTMGFSTELWLTLGAEFLCGMLAPFFQVGVNTLVLHNTDEKFVGRVNGTLTPLWTGAMLITMSTTGFLAMQLSLTFIFQIVALLYIFSAIAIIPLYRQSMRQLDT